jgi:hypothetical protein
VFRSLPARNAAAAGDAPLGNHRSGVERGLAASKPPWLPQGGFRLKDPALRAVAFRPAEGATRRALKAELVEAGPTYSERLTNFHALLERYHLHFGYRVIDEITTFVALARQCVGDDQASLATAFDLAVCQKVLPKLNAGRELDEPLRRLLAFMIDPDHFSGDEWRDAEERWSKAYALEGRLRFGNFVGLAELDGCIVRIDSRRISVPDADRMIEELVASVRGLPSRSLPPTGTSFDRPLVHADHIDLWAYLVVRDAVRGHGPHDLGGNGTNPRAPPRAGCRRTHRPSDLGRRPNRCPHTHRTRVPSSRADSRTARFPPCALADRVAPGRSARTRSRKPIDPDDRHARKPLRRHRARPLSSDRPRGVRARLRAHTDNTGAARHAGPGWL